MTLRQAMPTFLLLLLLLPLWTVSAGAQIPLGRKAKVEVDASSRVLVATPFLEGRDPADAVKVGNGLRDRISSRLGGKYTVIPRNLMNAALKHFGYKDDDVLPVAVVSNLAAQVKAGITIVTVLTPTASGGYAVKAEVRGLGTPVEVTLTQGDGQPLEDLGSAIADLIKSNM